MLIGLIVNTDKNTAIECSKEIAKFIIDNGSSVCANKGVAEIIGCKTKFDSDQDVIKNCDAVVTVGGDGTIIHNAKFAAKYDKPMIGINMGRVGFVAGLEKDEIKELKNLLNGKYKIQKRMLMNVTHICGKMANEYLCVNEASLSRDTLSPIVDLSVSLNSEKIITYRADGMIFSTPTGSTAYSFSAGGPVLEPDMNCILLTPVCPHALSSRQVVFSGSDELCAEFVSYNNSRCYLSIDGQNIVELSSNDKVYVKKSEYVLKLIILKEKNFYTLLNEKLKERDYYEE